MFYTVHLEWKSDKIFRKVWWVQSEWYRELFYEKSNANERFGSKKVFGGEPIVENYPIGHAPLTCLLYSVPLLLFCSSIASQLKNFLWLIVVHKFVSRVKGMFKQTPLENSVETSRLRLCSYLRFSCSLFFKYTPICGVRLLD